jgi:hypothetical protein
MFRPHVLDSRVKFYVSLLELLQLILDGALLDHNVMLLNLKMWKVDSIHYINNLFVAFVGCFNHW